MEGTGVKEVRRRLGLSQERFAQFLGVSLQTVRRWESGLTRPLPIISLRLKELERQTHRESQRGGGAVREQAGRSDEHVRLDIGLGLGGLFKGMGSLLDVLSKMGEAGSEEASQTGTVEAMGGKAKGVYGFSLRFGLDGKPVVERFGNIRETASGAVVAETREPLVDVLDEGDQILVIAEMPGVEEKDIHVRVNGDIVEITAATGDRRYQREVLLPVPVAPEKVETSYRNGVLKVELKKVLPGKA